MIARNLTRKKQIRNALLGGLCMLISSFYINYFYHPERLYDADSYVPIYIGSLIGTIIVYFTSKKKYEGDMNTKITDERDEMISKDFNAKVFPILLIYLPMLFMIIALPLNIKNVSFSNLMIVWSITLILYAVGYEIYHRIHS